MADPKPSLPTSSVIVPVRRPPSSLTRDDWIRIYGEEFVAWMELTPQERWRESMKLWVTFFALGGRLDDDFGRTA